MKCLSLREPLASLVMSGTRTVENRGWATRYRGPLAIHASAAIALSSEREDARRICLELGLEPPPMPDELAQMPRGVVLGTVELVDCQLGLEDPWAIPGSYQWVLKNPQPFEEPIAAKGRLGMWEWEPEAKKAL